ncbi:MAG TPA: VCBS repeat-containing protein, partial [Chthonomonadales bacterium]|nr:VCBS repeat-containing protein [Chthonomonadales bacterium]
MRLYNSLLIGLLCAWSLAGCHRVSEQPVQLAASSTTTQALFREVAAEVGLHFRWGRHNKPPRTILDTAAGGGGFIDYDQDGLLDILILGRRVALFHNEGAGRFRDVSAESGILVTGDLMGCAVGDFDNDGYPDLFITGYGIARLYRNEEGRGTFQDVTTRAGVGPSSRYAWASSAGFADLDSDGLLDLVVCHYVKFTPNTLQLCAYPGAEAGTACPPFYYEPQKIKVFRNRGGGKFQDVTAHFPPGNGNNLGLGFADFDEDGRLDFYVANDALPGDLYHNLGSWQFANIGEESGTAYNQHGGTQAGMGVDWGDYDRDGRMDLIVTTFQNEPRSLYRNIGHGLFVYASYTAGIGDATLARLGFGVTFVDYDNDGFLDLLFANGHVQDAIHAIHPPATYAQSMQLFRNMGNGVFGDVSEQGGPAFAKPIVGRAVAAGDYDNDG